MAFKAPAVAAAGAAAAGTTTSSISALRPPLLHLLPLRRPAAPHLCPSSPQHCCTGTGKGRGAASRRYATIRSAADASSGDQLPPWPRSAHPSPYEILGMEKHAEYNKRAYYKLAKLYHPDTTHASSSSSSSTSTTAHTSSSSSSSAHDPALSSHTHPDAAIRLERYRLLVAAHELLRDPGRRRLYDTTGLGWAHGHRAPSLRDMDRDWRSRPGSAANNATWEDWERWRAAQQGRGGQAPGGPVYMSHGMFASMVVALCMVGWLAQLTRAESAGDEYMAWMAEQNARIGKGLARDGVEAFGRTRDQRVDRFLRDRENTLYGYEPVRFERDEEQQQQQQQPPPRERRA